MSESGIPTWEWRLSFSDLSMQGAKQTEALPPMDIELGPRSPTPSRAYREAKVSFSLPSFCPRSPPDRFRSVLRQEKLPTPCANRPQLVDMS